MNNIIICWSKTERSCSQLSRTRILKLVGRASLGKRYRISGEAWKFFNNEVFVQILHLWVTKEKKNHYIKVNFFLFKFRHFRILKFLDLACACKMNIKTLSGTFPWRKSNELFNGISKFAIWPSIVQEIWLVKGEKFGKKPQKLEFLPYTWVSDHGQKELFFGCPLMFVHFITL